MEEREDAGCCPRSTVGTQEGTGIDSALAFLRDRWEVTVVSGGELLAHHTAMQQGIKVPLLQGNKGAIVVKGPARAQGEQERAGLR